MLNTSKLFGLIFILSCSFTEINCDVTDLNCNFDQSTLNTCKWKSSGSPATSIWKLGSSNYRYITLSGPLKPAANSVHHIQVYNGKSSLAASSADLVSTTITQSSSTGTCFSFYYYIHGEGVGLLALYLTANGKEQQIWRHTGSAGDLWHKYSINIDKSFTSFNLKFNLTAYTGAVALDELVATVGKCPSSSLCDFESGGCNWTISSSSSNYAFKLTQASGSLWSSSNPYDHSTESYTGHFMEASGVNAVISSYTSLTSPSMGYLFYQCLRFWYWRHNSQTNKIEAIRSIPGETSYINWTSNFTFPNKQWHRANVPIYINYGDNIVIKATKLDSSTSSSPIDIDDISLEPGNCPLPVNCDFNKDLCGWTKVLGGNAWWDWGIGRVEKGSALSGISVPPYDRTVPTDGMFLYTDFTQLSTSTTNYTMVLNSEFLPPTSGSCFKFYYLPLSFSDSRNAFKINLADSTGLVTSTPYTYNYANDPNSKVSYNSRKWTQTSVTIKSDKNFRISIVVTSFVASTYMALDDFIYTTGTCGATTLPPTIIPTLPTVAPGLSLDCNFESGTLCAYKNNPNTAYNPWQTVAAYVLSSTQSVNANMPKTDHTKLDKYGHYAYLRHNKDDQGQNNVASKQSSMTATDNMYPSYRGPVCLSLWYYLNTGGQAYFFVNVTTAQNIKVVSMTRNGNQGEKWNNLQVEYRQNSDGYQYRLDAFVSYGVVAIDDVSVKHQACVQADPNVFRCNFEGGHNCSFTPEYDIHELKLQWTLYNGSTTFIKIPDHSLKTLTGHFYALDFHVLRLNSLKTEGNYKIRSRQFRPTTSACITFSYYMTGLKKQENFNFYIMKENSITTVPLWKATGDLGPFWFSHRMTINSTTKWQIGFDVLTHDSDEGLVAIDDVIVELDKACPPKGKCDFEKKDTCMWESIKPNRSETIEVSRKKGWAILPINTSVDVNVVKYTDFEWIVHSSDDYSLTYYPTYDHTLKKSYGNYLLMNVQNPRQDGDRTVIVSDHYDIDPKNPSFCLKFHYWMIKKYSSGADGRFEVYQSESYDKIKKIGQVTSINANYTWIEFKVTAKALSTSSTNMWFYLVGDVASNYAFIAIDDISVEPGECGGHGSNISHVFNCSTTQTIPLSKVCDGVKDCLNGADELDCGSCAMNYPNDCGFHISIPAGPDINGYTWRWGNITAPLKEAPYPSKGFLVANRYRPWSDTEVSQLTSPKLKEVAAGCYIQFRYNIKGNMNKTYSLRDSHLAVILDIEGIEKTEIWSTDIMSAYEGMWRYGYAYVGRVNRRFGITYAATDQYSSTRVLNQSYVGITDIEMRGCSVTPSSTSCSTFSKPYKCRNGQCISPDYVCDYVDDCGDNTDELFCTAYKFRCDFEYGLCDWGRYRRDTWVRDAGYSHLVYGPTRDHTKGLHSGHYLMLKASGYTAVSSRIDGPILEPSSSCQMTFWLSMEGNSSDQVYFKIGGENLQTGIVHTFSNSYSFPLVTYSFTRHTVQLTGMTSAYRMIFTGTISKNPYSSILTYIAVDDISFSPGCIASTVVPGQSTTTPRAIVTTPNPCTDKTNFYCKTAGKCIDSKLVCNFHIDCPNGDKSDEQNCGNCTFEDTTNPMCGWNNIGYGKEQWSVKSAYSLSSSQHFPTRDATGLSSGHFLVIDTSHGGTSNIAAKITTPILGATAPTCKMTFSYRHTDINTLRVELVVNLYKSRSWTPFTKQLIRISATTTDWQSYSVPIGSLIPGYQVQITGDVPYAGASTTVYRDLEIDQIQFISCDNTTGTVNPSTTLNCTFENGTCGWRDLGLSTYNKIDWELTRSYTVSPGFDHTSKQRPRPLRSGTWIYTHRTIGMTGNNSATLITASSQPINPKPKCLTFWYHLFGKDPVDFEVRVSPNTSPYYGQRLWVKRIPQSNNWALAQVDVPTQITAHYLMFAALLVGKSRDVVGLDDITYTDGNCPPTPSCDFEVDFCKWQSTATPPEFVRMTPTTNSFPTLDHTLGAKDGHYIKVAKVNTEVHLTYTIQKGNFLNPNPYYPPGIQHMCLKYFYYMHGAQDTGTYIQVTTNRTGIQGPKLTASFLNSNNALNQWILNRVPLSLALNDKILLNAMITSQTSIVAFDDINVQHQACEQPGWCDFENDFCGWSNAPAIANRKQVVWLRNSGETESDLSGPEEDHTTRSEDGWYAFVPLDAQSDGVAILQSEILTISQSVCFGFYYDIESEDDMRTAAKLSVWWVPNGNLKKQSLGVINSTGDDSWIGWNATVTSTGVTMGRFVLRTYEGQSSLADVAIDDIYLKPGVCGGKVITTTTTSGPTTPEPLAQKKWDCSFLSQCNWNANGTGFKVTYWNANTAANGPRLDHTYKSLFGQYLSYDSALIPNGANPIMYTSTVIDAPGFSSVPVCFSLWYYVNTETQYTLSLGFYSTFNTIAFIELWKTPGAVVARQWKQAMANVYNIRKGQLAIKLVHNTPFSGAIAIDDIRVTKGFCQPSDANECDFSSGYCGYTVQRTATPGYALGIGSITTGAAKAAAPGPAVDHTTGDMSGSYFLFSKPSTVRNLNYRTNLVINNLPSTGYRQQCLKFWYQINSQYTTAFQIYVVTTTTQNYYNPKWQVKYTNFTEWTLGQLTISAPYTYKIVFSLNQGQFAPIGTYIALDDISLNNGVCEPPITCDFDTDMCSYNNLQTTGYNWNWARFTGPPSTNTKWFGPTYDHTRQRAGGSYLYLTLKSNIYQTQRIGTIESMTAPLVTAKCLILYTQLRGADTSLDVSVVKYGPAVPVKTQVQTMFRINGTTNSVNTWSKVSVNIDPKQLTNTKDFGIRIKGQLKVQNSFIALDDITLVDGRCAGTVQNVFFCWDGTQLNMSKVCDFVNDCPINPTPIKGQSAYDDEKDCGACDFERGNCTWNNKYKAIGEQWILKAANNSSRPAGPTSDGTNNPSGHYMIVNPNSRSSSRADLVSSNTAFTQLKKSYQSCQMTFHYYMSISQGMPTQTKSYIAVTARTDVSSYNTVWRMSGNQGNVWQKAVVTIGEWNRPFYLEILGAYPGRTNVLAIDDIAFQNCAPPAPTTGQCPANQIQCPNSKVCINKYVLCDSMNDCGDNWDENIVNCNKRTVLPITFEPNRMYGPKAIERDTGSNTQWQLIHSYAVDNSRLTGPVTDHTYRIQNYGSFLALRYLSSLDSGKKSRFVTPMVRASAGNTCALRVFYYMFGNPTQMASLTISVRYSDPTIKSTVTPFTKSGNNGQQWSRAILTVTDQRPFQFVIEGTVGKGLLSDIAIDDLMFSDGCLSSSVNPFTTISTIHPITNPTQHHVTGGHITTGPITGGPITGGPITTGPITGNPNTPTPVSGGTVSPTKSNQIGKSGEKPKNNGGKIAAGVLVPIFVIGAILGFLFWRRYKQRQTEDDRVAFTNHVYDTNEVTESNQ